MPDPAKVNVEATPTKINPNVDLTAESPSKSDPLLRDTEVAKLKLPPLTNEQREQRAQGIIKATFRAGTDLPELSANITEIVTVGDKTYRVPLPNEDRVAIAAKVGAKQELGSVIRGDIGWSESNLQRIRYLEVAMPFDANMSASHLIPGTTESYRLVLRDKTDNQIAEICASDKAIKGSASTPTPLAKDADNRLKVLSNYKTNDSNSENLKEVAYLLFGTKEKADAAVVLLNGATSEENRAKAQKVLEGESAIPKTASPARTVAERAVGAAIAGTPQGIVAAAITGKSPEELAGAAVEKAPEIVTAVKDVFHGGKERPTATPPKARPPVKNPEPTPAAPRKAEESRSEQEAPAVTAPVEPLPKEFQEVRASMEQLLKERNKLVTLALDDMKKNRRGREERSDHIYRGQKKSR